MHYIGFVSLFQQKLCARMFVRYIIRYPASIVLLEQMHKHSVITMN